MRRTRHGFGRDSRGHRVHVRCWRPDAARAALPSAQRVRGNRLSSRIEFESRAWAKTNFPRALRSRCRSRLHRRTLHLEGRAYASSSRMVTIDAGGPACFHCLTMSRRASVWDTPRARAATLGGPRPMFAGVNFQRPAHRRRGRNKERARSTTETQYSLRVDVGMGSALSARLDLRFSRLAPRRRRWPASSRPSRSASEG